MNRYKSKIMTIIHTVYIRNIKVRDIQVEEVIVEN